MSLFESSDGSRIREDEPEAPRLRRAARRASAGARRRERAAVAVASQGDLFPELIPDSLEAGPEPAIEAPEAPARPALRLVELPRRVEEGAREAPAPPVAEGREHFTAEMWFELGTELEPESALEARAAYHRALELNPRLVEAHVDLGRLYHEAGEHGKAEAHYRDATQLAPREATSHYNLGVLLEDLDRGAEAVYAYRQALARDPDCADAHYNLALVLERMGRKSDAISHLAKARALYGPDGRRDG